MSLRCSVPIFLIFIFGLSTIFQFVPDMAGDAIAVAFAGFFLGPIAPAALSIVSGHVPKPLLSATVSILMSFGLVGSVLAPVLMGVASSAGGLRYLPATVMGAAVTLSVIWTIAELSWRKADANGGKASTEADSDSLD
jgi:MFS family permease